jgi:hypothetical protein
MTYNDTHLLKALFAVHVPIFNCVTAHRAFDIDQIDRAIHGDRKFHPRLALYADGFANFRRRVES